MHSLLRTHFGFARRGAPRVAALIASVAVLLVGVQPAAAHDGESHDATAAHRQADVPRYDADDRRELSGSVAAARSGRSGAREAERLQGILTAGFSAFSLGTEAQTGVWSAPIDPAEPDDQPGGIASPYFASDLLQANAPDLPDGVEDPWDEGYVWGLFPKVVPVFVALLPNGKLLYWDWKKSGSPGADDTWPENTRVVLWDPATGTAKRSDPPFPANVFCAGYSHLPNGDLLLAGGNITFDQLGIDQTFIYHWRTDAWSPGPDMDRRRWYPSVAGLANGEALILGGDPIYPGPPINEFEPAVPEVYTPQFGEGAHTGGSLRSLSNLPFPGNSIAPRSHRLYPYLTPALDGRVLYAGPDQELIMIDTQGDGDSEMFDFRDDVVREYGSFAQYDKGRVLVGGGGENALFDKVAGPAYQPSPGKEFDHGATASSSRIDLLREGGSEASDPAQGLPAAAASSPMATPRRMHNMTTLPDGTILATGGMSSTDPDPADCQPSPPTACPDPSDQNYNNQLYNPDHATKTAELWDPATGDWTALSPAAKIRQYHSIATLMPDGTVLTGGGGICGACTMQNYFEPNFEIFSPPYLFKREADFPGQAGDPAPRPLITEQLTDGMLPPVAYGQTFEVDYSTDDGAGNGTSTPIDGSTGAAVLMKLGAPTHGVDQGQRRVPLKVVSATAGTLSLLAPPNAYEAPPGYYMLFLIDGRGVPSKAAVIEVGAQLALENVRAAVTVFTEPSRQGESQVLGAGVFKSTDGNLADVGNDAVRSMTVHPEFEATVCTDAAGTDCALAAPGEYPQLGTAFDKRISHLLVAPATGAATDPRLTEIVPVADPPPPPPQSAPSPEDRAPAISLPKKIRKAATLRIRFSCSSRCRAAVRISGGRRAIAIGARKSKLGSVKVDAAGRRITVRLSRVALRTITTDLRRRKKVTFKVTLTDAQGRRAVATARMR